MHHAIAVQACDQKTIADPSEPHPPGVHHAPGNAIRDQLQINTALAGRVSISRALCTFKARLSAWLHSGHDHMAAMLCMVLRREYHNTAEPTWAAAVECAVPL
jgi:hypothetical protein